MGDQEVTVPNRGNAHRLAQGAKWVNVPEVEDPSRQGVHHDCTTASAVLVVRDYQPASNACSMRSAMLTYGVPEGQCRPSRGTGWKDATVTALIGGDLTPGVPLGPADGSESRLQVVSVFSGAMGLDLGLEATGFELRFAADNMPAAVETAQTNRPGLPVYPGDVSELDADRIYRIPRASPRARWTCSLVDRPARVSARLGSVWVWTMPRRARSSTSSFGGRRRPRAFLMEEREGPALGLRALA